MTRPLADLYRGGVKLERAARAVGLYPEEARRRLQLDGDDDAPAPVGPPVALLARLYLDERLSVAGIAERVELTPDQVTRRLRRAGIRRPSTGRPRTKLRVDPAVLEDLYLRQGLTIREISPRVGLHQRDVWRQLAEAGISRRRRGVTSAVDRAKATLEDLYVDRGLNLPATARALGVTTATVRRQLAVHGIPQRPGGRRPLSRQLLERLYVDEELSRRQIADRLGLTQSQVRYDLLRLGIPRRRGGRPDRGEVGTVLRGDGQAGGPDSVPCRRGRRPRRGRAGRSGRWTG